MNALTLEQRKKIKIKGLAQKHGCSEDYVQKVLKGDREANSFKAKSILEDAHSLLNILEQYKNEA